MMQWTRGLCRTTFLISILTDKARHWKTDNIQKIGIVKLSRIEESFGCDLLLELSKLVLLLWREMAGMA